MTEQPAFSLTQQALAWLNGITFSGFVLFVFIVSRWLTKREAEAKNVISDIQVGIATIRDNHLAHIQSAAEETKILMKEGQEKATLEAERHKGDVVSAIQTSTLAIVQAINARPAVFQQQT